MPSGSGTGGEGAKAPCADKIAFTTRKQAKATAAVAQFRYGGKPPKAYICRHCGLWHLSSS